MRVLDVGVAALICLSSTSFIIYWNPTTFSNPAASHLEQASLRGLLLTTVSAEGVQWFQNASPDQICSSLSGFSNSSITLSATIGGVPCGPGQPGDRPSASLSLPFESKVVVLRAWANEGR